MNQDWLKFTPVYISKKLLGKYELQAAIGNVFWLFADKFVRLCLGMFVGIWLARYLGPSQFGIYNYALAFVSLFSAFSSLGLDNIVIRDIVREPAQCNEIIGSAFLLKLGGSLAVFCLTIGSISIVRNGDSLTRCLVVIVAAGLIFQSFDVIDFWFQSQVLSKYTVYAKNTAFFLVSLWKIVLIVQKAPLLSFAWAGLTEVMIGSVGLLVVYRLKGHSPHKWRPSLSVAGKLLHDSWPLIFSVLVITVYMKIDQIMLVEMVGNEALGFYSAAVGISEVWYFIPMAIASSVSPAIIRLREVNNELYYTQLQNLFDGLTVVAYAIAIPMTFISKPLMLLLYGPEFAVSGTVLAIHVWGGLFVFLGVARSIWIISEGATKIALMTTFTGALLNVLLNLLLIPKYGAIGAAIATVVSYGFSDYLIFMLFPPLRKVGWLMTRSLRLHFLFQAWHRNKGN